MRKLLIIACFLMIGSLQAQDSNPLYEKAGDLVKVTNFYEDGTIKEQGFYKNKVITGTWVTFDSNGNKTAIAHYDEGKKTGKWFLWSNDGLLREINYENNTIASVQSWKEDSKVAFK